MDVVDDDHLAESVLGRELLGGIDDGLVVRAVVAWSGSGDADANLAVAVRVERQDVAARPCRLGRLAELLVSCVVSSVVSSVVARLVVVGRLGAVGTSRVVVAAACGKHECERRQTGDERGDQIARRCLLLFIAVSPLVLWPDGQTI